MRRVTIGRSETRPPGSQGPSIADGPSPADHGVERWSACYAPHSSMYFDQFGKVRACCQNTGTYLGDVRTQTLREIWESADAERMRAALEHDSYDEGCSFCAWQSLEGNDDIVFARFFDPLEPRERRPRWPRKMEFSLTNTCNLACVMCNGDWSSTIRAKRERREPIPASYGDAFFEQLQEFLPHLEEASFLGGEPFLGTEPQRVMELLADLHRPPRVTVTTNGTIYTNRVRRILEQLAPHIVVSIDGATPETYDAVRVGAHLPDVLANLDRYREVLGPGKVSITHCLMTHNWHEFFDLLQIAEERDLIVGVNVVRLPTSSSLYQLPLAELREVVGTLQATDVSTLTGPRLSIWEGHVGALANRLEVLELEAVGTGVSIRVPGTPALPTHDSPWPWLPFAVVADHPSLDPPPATEAPSMSMEVGTDPVLRVVHADPAFPVRVDDLEGADVQELGARLGRLCGPPESWESTVGDVPDRLYLDAGGVLAITLTARRDPDGHLIGATCFLQARG